MLVVRQNNDTLRLIRQPDHAQASGQLAARWRRPTVIPEAMWPRLVEGVRRHDVGWQDAETLPAVDEHGRPHSFKTLPLDEHMGIWRRGVALTVGGDAYVGLVVALHARWLYTELMHPAEGGEVSHVQAFIEELDQWIDGAIQRLAVGNTAERTAVEPAALTAARRLLGALDGLSLQLCGALPFGPFPEPVPYGERAERMSFVATAGGAAVSPWPFVDEAVTVTVAARDVPDRVYGDAAELGETLEAARPVTLRFTVVQGG